MPHIRNEESCFIASGDLGCIQCKRANRQINAFVILDSSSPPNERSLLPFSCPSFFSISPSFPHDRSLYSLTCADLASTQRQKDAGALCHTCARRRRRVLLWSSSGPLVNASRLWPLEIFVLGQPINFPPTYFLPGGKERTRYVAVSRSVQCTLHFNAVTNSQASNYFPTVDLNRRLELSSKVTWLRQGCSLQGNVK